MHLPNKRPGSRRPSSSGAVAALCAGLILVSVQVAGEEGLGSAIEACARVDDPEGRLACYDSLALAVRSMPAASSESPKQEQDLNGSVQVTVIRVDGNFREPRIFHFSSGEVWRQTQQRAVDVPTVPFAATLSSGAFGSHRLRIGENGRAIGVKQVE